MSLKLYTGELTPKLVVQGAFLELETWFARHEAVRRMVERRQLRPMFAMSVRERLGALIVDHRQLGDEAVFVNHWTEPVSLDFIWAVYFRLEDLAKASPTHPWRIVHHDKDSARSLRFRVLAASALWAYLDPAAAKADPLFLCGC